MFYHHHYHHQHNHHHHYHYFIVKFFNPYYNYYYYYYYYYYYFFFFSRNASDPAVSFQKLILHCITAIDKSPKSFEIITTENEADDGDDSHICVSHSWSQQSID